MLRVHLTDEERQALRLHARREVGHVSERIHFVLLSDRDYSPPEIAHLFGYCEDVVRHWLKQYLDFGLEGLYDEPRSGRPPKADPLVEETIQKTIMRGDPADHEIVRTFWTVAPLAFHLALTLGVVLQPSAVRQTLHRLGLRWGRPRLAMPDKKDPESAAQQWAIAKAAVEAGPEDHILYADETDIQLLPLIRAMWHWVGQQIRIPTPGTNVKRSLFGALNIRTGRWVYSVFERKTKESFVAFLELLLEAYPAGQIILIVDNFSSHKAHLVRQWLATHPRVQIFYLPTYASNLNSVERIWARLKDRVAANRYYGTMGALLEAVDRFFQEVLTPEQALAWAA